MPEKRFNAEMEGGVRKQLLALCVLVVLLLGHGLAHAARTFSYSQTPTPPAAIFPMGSTQSLSYLITNTNTAPNTGERIFTVRIRINSGSTFTAATVAPAGWTLTTRTTTTATYRANAWANAIVPGASQSFTIVVLMRTSTADVNDKLRDIRSSYTTSTTFSFTSGTITSTVPNPPAPPTLPSAAGTWMLSSLTVAMQITDLSGVPISSIAAGSSFRVVMTVTNKSTATQNGITSNPNPPSRTTTGTTTPTLTGTAGSPLNLTAGSSGTITFTYSTAVTKYGTVYFTASAQRISTVTSASAISPTLTVIQCVFSASITASDSCQYPGQNISLTMLLTNNCSVALTTVTPTLSTTGPATLVSGPTPATIASIPAGGGTASVGWVYQLNTAAATNPFTFTGAATSASPALTTPLAASPSILRGEFGVVLTPATTNASSTNVELDWDVTNNGCAAANSVAVTSPAGWVSANDAYSLVNLNATTAVETWVPSGANPVTFTSPNVASQLPLAFDGDFFLVFSATPANAGTSIFNVDVTDANGAVVSVPVSVTVNPYADADGLNSVNNNAWREQFP
jgi:hypothetical protein